MKCVIDSSVWVSATMASEISHASSVKSLQVVQDAKVEAACPEFTLVECAAAIARRTNNPQQAAELVALIKQFSGVEIAATTSALTKHATLVAQVRRLRAGDAIHIAASEQCEARFVTLDEELMQRSGMGNLAMKPADWIARS